MNICVMYCMEDFLSIDTGASIRVHNISKQVSNMNNTVNVIIPGMTDKKNQLGNYNVFQKSGYVPKKILEKFSKILEAKKISSLFFYDIFFLIKCLPTLIQSNIIQIETGWSGPLIILMNKLFLRKKIIIDSHDVFQSLRLSNKYTIRTIIETFFESISYKHANMIFVVSDKERKMLQDYGYSKEKIIVIKNGVDIDEYSKTYSEDVAYITKKYDLTNKKIVIFVGNMEYYPNIEAAKLISDQILPEINKANLDIEFLFVGRCPEILRAKINERVIITGVVESIPPFLKASDVAIAPLFKGSGTRLKILEYFASEIPVISTSIGSEGLDVRNGFHIITENNIQKYPLRILELLDDRHLAKTLTANAKNFVEENYSWESICKLINESYVKLM